MVSSGIVGLSPKAEGMGDLFIEKFKEREIIDEAVFSMYIDLANETSKMQFGGYDLQTYAVKDADLHFHSLSPSTASHWQLDLPNVSLWSKTPGQQNKY